MDQLHISGGEQEPPESHLGRFVMGGVKRALAWMRQVGRITERHERVGATLEAYEACTKLLQTFAPDVGQLPAAKGETRQVLVLGGFPGVQRTIIEHNERGGSELYRVRRRNYFADSLPSHLTPELPNFSEQVYTVTPRGLTVMESGQGAPSVGASSVQREWQSEARWIDASEIWQFTEQLTAEVELFAVRDDPFLASATFPTPVTYRQFDPFAAQGLVSNANN